MIKKPEFIKFNGNFYKLENVSYLGDIYYILDENGFDLYGFEVTIDGETHLLTNIDKEKVTKAYNLFLEHIYNNTIINIDQ